MAFTVTQWDTIPPMRAGKHTFAENGQDSLNIRLYFVRLEFFRRSRLRAELFSITWSYITRGSSTRVFIRPISSPSIEVYDVTHTPIHALQHDCAREAIRLLRKHSERRRNLADVA